MMVMPRIVRNLRPRVDANTCGQAAVATMLAAHSLAPFTWKRLSDGEAIDYVLRSFPPDVPFGLGTSAFRIVHALRGYGIPAERVHSGLFGLGAGEALVRLRDHVGRGLAATVCIDTGQLGSRPWTAHWAIALEVTDERVRLGNMGNGEVALDLDRFMTVWRCRHLPFTHNHCAVLVGGIT